MLDVLYSYVYIFVCDNFHLISLLLQSRWALSADDSLQSIGTHTGINYAKDYKEYLEILMTGLKMKKRSILNVFREWDRVVFPNSDSSLVKAQLDGGLKTAMAMLAADESEDGENEL